MLHATAKSGKHCTLFSGFLQYCESSVPADKLHRGFGDVFGGQAEFSEKIGGKELYLRLKERGVLIRHFDKPEIAAWSRITIGTREQMDVFLKNVREILEEQA